MGKRYLITGGAGFLGINLVRYLLKKGFLIRTLDIAEFDYPEKDQVEIFRGDIRDKKIVDKAVRGSDIVIHGAAALPLYTKEEIFSTEIDGTKNVLESAFKHGVKRVVHISSTAVYGVPDHSPIKEDDKLEGVGHYGVAKILAEEICLEYRQKGMCIPIIRPKSFIGPERLGVFALLYDWAKDGKNFPILGSGNNRYQFLDVEDLCEAIFLTVTLEEKKVNDTFNIGAKKFTTIKEDFQEVLEYAGFGKKIIPFPAAMVKIILRLLEFFRLSPLYKWVYETAATDSYVSIEKAEKVLGFSPKYSNKEALLRNYCWYLQNLSKFQNKTGISHRVPWKQGALKVLKKFF
ncbi:MAG: NAD-dependent epimerase/dehydratase family protein [Dethiobacteria bacterium]|jgi:nucleoside-diphosphate-sugar epimerase